MISSPASSASTENSSSACGPNCSAEALYPILMGIIGQYRSDRAGRRALRKQVFGGGANEADGARAVVGADVAREPAQEDRGLARVLGADQIGRGGRLVG